MEIETAIFTEGVPKVQSIGISFAYRLSYKISVYLLQDLAFLLPNESSTLNSVNIDEETVINSSYNLVN